MMEGIGGGVLSIFCTSDKGQNLHRPSSIGCWCLFFNIRCFSFFRHNFSSNELVPFALVPIFRNTKMR